MAKSSVYNPMNQHTGRKAQNQTAPIAKRNGYVSVMDGDILKVKNIPSASSMSIIPNSLRKTGNVSKNAKSSGKLLSPPSVRIRQPRTACIVNS
jgi:hypothetical protein